MAYDLDVIPNMLWEGMRYVRTGTLALAKRKIEAIYGERLKRGAVMQTSTTPPDALINRIAGFEAMSEPTMLVPQLAVL